MIFCDMVDEAEVCMCGCSVAWKATCRGSDRHVEWWMMSQPMGSIPAMVDGGDHVGQWGRCLEWW